MAPADAVAGHGHGTRYQTCHRYKGRYTPYYSLVRCDTTDSAEWQERPASDRTLDLVPPYSNIQRQLFHRLNFYLTSYDINAARGAQTERA